MGSADVPPDDGAATRPGILHYIPDDDPAGLDTALVRPGLVLVPHWRPDAGTPGERDWPVQHLACAALARKPD